jgi:hypothetical protein
MTHFLTFILVDGKLLDVSEKIGNDEIGVG